MEKKINIATYAGFIIIAFVFLGSDIGLDYLIDTEASIQTKVWFAILISVLCFTIAKQFTNSKIEKNEDTE